MSYRLVVLIALPAAMAAQEANSGFDLSLTASGIAAGTQMLTEDPRDGIPAMGGFRLIAYPTWKIDEHWNISAALQVNSEPYFYQDFYTPGYSIETEILQATVSYSRFWHDRNALVIRAGQMPTAFGSFMMRYDDAVNPLIDMPISYGYYYTGVTTRSLAGAEADLTLGRADVRAQFTNSSPANPRGLLDRNQYGGWSGGAGYTIWQGIRVGASVYRGPYLDSGDTWGLEHARKLPATGYGLDLQWGHGPWTVNGELQRFQWVNHLEPGINERVGYAEVRRTLTPRWYIAARYGALRQDVESNRQVLETAVGYRLGARQLLKFDYEISKDADGRDHIFAVQFVAQLHPLSVARDGGARKGDKAGEAVTSGAAVDGIGGKSDGFTRCGGAACGDQSRGGVEKNDIAGRAGLSVENGVSDGAVAVAVPAAQRFQTGAPDSKIVGLPDGAEHGAAAYLEDQSGSSGRDLVEAVGSVNDERMFRFESGEGMGHQFRGFGRRGSNQLVAGAGRVGEWSQKVENGPHLQFEAGGLGMLHGRVQRGGEEESDTGVGDRRGDQIRLVTDVHAEGFQDIGAAALAGHGSVAMLGDAHPGAGRDERRDRGDIERRAAVSAGAAGVQQRVTVGGNFHAARALAHGARKSGKLGRGHRLHAQGGKKGGDLRHRSLAVKNDQHGRARVLSGEMLVRSGAVKEWKQRVHASGKAD